LLRILAGYFKFASGDCGGGSRGTERLSGCYLRWFGIAGVGLVALCLKAPLLLVKAPIREKRIL
jgi:hypothetical protein